MYSRAESVARLRAYVLRRTIDGPITYFRCQEPSVPAASDWHLRWTSFATGSVAVVPVPGLHGNFHRAPQLSAVVTGLRTRLESAQTQGHEDRRPW